MGTFSLLKPIRSILWSVALLLLGPVANHSFPTAAAGHRGPT